MQSQKTVFFSSGSKEESTSSEQMAMSDSSTGGGFKEEFTPREHMDMLNEYIVKKGRRPRLVKSNIVEVDVSGVVMTIVTYKPARYGTDDAMYRKNPVLGKILPRGCSFIILPSLVEGEEVDVVRLFGTRKFGGFKPSDDDDVQDKMFSGKNCVNNGIITLDGRELLDVRSIVYTEKSNGENMKSGLFVHNDVVYLMAGSKMTANIWKADTPFEGCGLTEDDHAPNPGETICTMWSKFYLQLTESDRVSLVKMFTSGMVLSFVAEINRPWGEHMVPISHIFIEFFTVLDHNGIPMSPKDSFKIFQSLGLSVKNEEEFGEIGFYHVPFKTFDCPEGELGATVQRISDEIIHASDSPTVKTEGGVFVLCDENGVVVAFVKVKNDWYAYWRRVREQCKRQETTLPSLKAAIRRLTFLNSYEENVEKWVIWAELFFTHFRSLSEEKQKYVLAIKYASYVAEFVAENTDFEARLQQFVDEKPTRLQQFVDEKATLEATIVDLKAQKETLSGVDAGEVGMKVFHLLKKVTILNAQIKEIREMLSRSE